MTSPTKTITRRALLQSAPAVLAITALPIAVNALEAEAPAGPAIDLQTWLDDQTPAQRANYHQTHLAMAMCEMSPGKWRTAVTEKQDFVIVVRDEQTSPERASVFVQYLY